MCADGGDGREHAAGQPYGCAQSERARHRVAQDDLDISGNRVSCQVDSDALSEVLARLVAAGVRSLASQPPTLEELFLRHYADPS